MMRNKEILSSGTMVIVGSHQVMIERYISEGGFALVYLVQIVSPISLHPSAVLKRVYVPSKDQLGTLRVEVDTLKRLKGHKNIVSYIDSHASHLANDAYEVFLLMEYCPGGGLIDFMNTRLQTRLTEAEILKIMADIGEGVACMHYQKPPIVHRDLKIENVLIGADGTFKLCDFGSSSPPLPVPTSAKEFKDLEHDILHNTTVQYRSPEMIDIYRRQPIDEKSDIWALGVLLYKLCYYTTPFENESKLAWLNGNFKFPSYPVYTSRLRRLITSMLNPDPEKRLNIYQVVKEICLMSGIPCPIIDIYSNTPKLTRSKTGPAEISAKAGAQGYKNKPTLETKEFTPSIKKNKPITLSKPENLSLTSSTVHSNGISEEKNKHPSESEKIKTFTSKTRPKSMMYIDKYQNTEQSFTNKPTVKYNNPSRIYSRAGSGVSRTLSVNLPRPKSAFIGSNRFVLNDKVLPENSIVTPTKSLPTFKSKLGDEREHAGLINKINTNTGIKKAENSNPADYKLIDIDDSTDFEKQVSLQNGDYISQNRFKKDDNKIKKQYEKKEEKLLDISSPEDDSPPGDFFKRTVSRDKEILIDVSIPGEQSLMDKRDSDLNEQSGVRVENRDGYRQTKGLQGLVENSKKSNSRIGVKDSNEGIEQKLSNNTVKAKSSSAVDMLGKDSRIEDKLKGLSISKKKAPKPPSKPVRLRSRKELNVNGKTFDENTDEDYSSSRWIEDFSKRFPSISDI